MLAESTSGLTGLLAVWGGLLVFCAFVVLVVLAVLAMLMPYFVYKISNSVQDCKARTINLDENTKRTNILLRQLIRAYGHEPEA
jgi:hypothetical protein